MYDIVGRIWAILFGMMVLFMGTTTIYAQKQDTVVQNYVDNAVEEFVDTARASGCITQDNYETFIEKLDATKNVYDVSIIHYEEQMTPTKDADGNNTYETTYEAHDRQDIIHNLYSGSAANETQSSRYDMKTGDFLRVSVENTSPTLGRQLMGMFTGGGAEGGQIMASYGGYVGNESDASSQ